MISKFGFWFLAVGVCSTSAVIYHLNETEYKRMPPLFSLDDYDSCLVEEGSTYCVLDLNLYAEPGNGLMHMISEYSEHKSKHYNHTLIDRGVCVKKTCQKYIRNVRTSEELRGSLEACLNASLHSEYGLSARVSTLYHCERDSEPRHVDPWDWAVLALLLALVAVNVAGTLYDYCVTKRDNNSKNDENTSTILLSFSVIRNWNFLTNTESYDRKLLNLQFVHGIRVISNICVILAHTLVLFSVGFTINSRDLEESFNHPVYLMIFSGMMFTQLFFFISGFLTVYKIRVKEETKTLTIWDIPLIILYRFSRILPSLAITLALATTWVRHVSSGPLWNRYITGMLVADCRKHWWRHLLFINNYIFERNICLLHTWQLAADVQIFLVCVTVYILTRGRTRRLVLGALLLFSAAAPVVHTVLQDLDAIILTPEACRTTASPTFWLQHILGHNNLPCFIIGMANAARIYEWHKTGGHFGENRVSLRVAQYLVVPAMVLLLYSGSSFYEDGARPSLLYRAAYSGAVRPLLGLTCALASLSYFVTTPTLIKSLFEWRGWVVPSRISYSLYLMHPLVIHVLGSSMRQLVYFSGFNLISSFVGLLVVSYLVTLPFYLLVEAPCTALLESFNKKITLQTQPLNISKKNE